MPTVTRTVTTPTSLETVWGYLSDFTTVREWDPNTPRCQRVEGDGGVGSIYAITSVFRERETQLRYTVLTHVMQERFILRGENSTVTVLEDMTFGATTSGGTTVGYRAEFTFHGAARFAVPLLGGALRGIADDAQAGMQRALDALRLEA